MVDAILRCVHVRTPYCRDLRLYRTVYSRTVEICVPTYFRLRLLELYLPVIYSIYGFTPVLNIIPNSYEYSTVLYMCLYGTALLGTR